MARFKSNDTGGEKWLTNDASSSRSDDQPAQRRAKKNDEVIRTSSREELMECIKRGQKPEWVPTPGFQALCEQEEALREQRMARLSRTPSPTDTKKPKTPASENATQSYAEAQNVPQRQQEPLERPRSALHRGDFSDEQLPASDFWTNPEYQPGLAISTNFNVGASPPRSYTGSPRPTSFDAASHVRALSQINTSFTSRRRAPSLGSSLSSSFVMRTPTSPLVHATSNPYLDFQADESEPDQSRHLRDNPRRRTLPPNSFQSLSMTPGDATPPNFSRPLPPGLRREASMPCHTHQSRRSLSSFTYHPRSNPHTPLIRTRRPSMSSESGSRRRASMVGSFEESILRGRMSTPPSKPLDFVAQIGVMGKGDCPGNLKCPAHVSVPFPAVFYNYPASTEIRSVTDDTPSPYVGTIDLDHNLKPIVLGAKKGRRSTSTKNGHDEDAAITPETEGQELAASSGKVTIGGAYRVPKQGQLQIIIKNPNKTAVKLFLVPYDLEGVEAGTKTFVRQRSFSSGPIIENALGDKNSRPTTVDPLENKHILRYLVHIKFCCPAKNRFYLYDNIRVVFANRVPDGKEKLRNEVNLPEPRFSTYKPLKCDSTSKVSKGIASTPRTDSLEFESPQFFGDMDGIQAQDAPASPTPSKRRGYNPSPIHFQTIPARSAAAVSKLSESPDAERTPFQLPDVKHIPNRMTTSPPPARVLPPVTGFEASSPLRGSPIPWRSPPGSNNATRSFSPAPVEARDSLLSRQFRELNGQLKLPGAASSVEQKLTGTD
ncbi:hypothetical protein H2198_006840 [Neophaeococcomyces mojaviensis]|uniref:Uncharacterized protein n=1 Tax=Neophaeococcomyces mojaviensis TaxID=3383035 RepID=A0ACC3A231_9EURO|nr:hypothetical protein H2198_006840 [Knufia sp. JES_112]